MPPAENKAIVRRFIEDFMNGGDAAVATALVAPAFIEHEPTPIPVHGPDGLAQFFGMLRAAFPDLHFAVEDVIAEGDRVVCRMRFHVTHRGAFFGMAPTGRSATVDVIDIFRVTGGQIVEHWGVLDQLGLMQQLGPPPAAPPAA
jgi:predicted ester cyclase